MLPNPTVKSLVAVAVNASTVTGSALDISDYEGNITIIIDAAAQGSGVTNAMKITDDGSGSYADSTGGGFSSVGNAASQQAIVLNSDVLGKHIKLVQTIAGGSSTGAVSATVVGFKKYQ